MQVWTSWLLSLLSLLFFYIYIDPFILSFFSIYLLFLLCVWCCLILWFTIHKTAIITACLELGLWIVLTSKNCLQGYSLDNLLMEHLHWKLHIFWTRCSYTSYPVKLQTNFIYLPICILNFKLKHRNNRGMTRQGDGKKKRTHSE